MSTEQHHWHLTWIGSDRLLARRVARPVGRFLLIEASGGILLLLGTVVALVWFNAATHSYESFWSTPVDLSIGSFSLDLTLHDWVNDGLMTLFFFVAGMEIKREMVSGELRDPKAAALPIIAALGGMVVPALIYASLNAGGVGARGWGIPMATDIAFAVGVVALLGSRVPVSLKLFLLTLAVTDDLGGIAVIAIFYSQGISFAWLGATVAVFVGMYLMRRAGIRYLPLYLVLGVIAWYFMLKSGVHATVAGVVTGFLTPTRPLRSEVEGQAVVERLENQPELSAADVRRASFLIRETVPVNERLTDWLHPWTSFVIIPIFALANAAIPLNSSALREAAASAVTMGAFLGLVVGKTVGVFGASWLAIKVGLARKPRGVTWMQILGIAMAAGIGFTVAMFVTSISFDSIALQEQAKVGIFAASIAAAVLSSVVLVLAHRRTSAAELVLEEAEEEELFERAPAPQVVQASPAPDGSLGIETAPAG